jgi:hypothetical protein
MSRGLENKSVSVQVRIERSREIRNGGLRFHELLTV